MKISPPVIECIQNRFHPAAIRVDQQGRIKSWEGNFTWYGLKPDAAFNQPIYDLLPALWGLDLHQPHHLPFVELENGLSTDIQVNPQHADVTLIVLMDLHAEMQARQQLQQASHNEQILNEKLRRTTELLRQKNTELDRANQAKNEFISGVSHELRTPLTSIIGHAEWLAKRCDQSATGHNNLETIERNAKYLLALIDSLLEQGKLTAGSFELTATQFNTTDFFQSLLDTFRPIADEKGLQIDISCQLEKLPTLYTDEHYLRLILVNILGNAVKYTEQGGISLRAVYDEQLSIEIKDSGIGIPSEDLENIFTAFRRAENTRGIGGIGLGLSIVWEVIQAMQGKIEIHSQVGEGTSVKIALPVKKAPEEPAAKYPEKAQPRLKNIRVMLFEDDPDIVMIYRLFLENAGMRPIVPENFTDPVAAVEKEQPDIIVVDYNLGEFNGLTIVRGLRAQGIETPIIMLTATTGINDSLKRDAQQAGCNAFLYKPRDTTNLSQVIEAVIGHES